MDYIQIRKVYTYDSLGRLSSVSSGDGPMTDLKYDGAGNLISIGQKAMNSGMAGIANINLDKPAPSPPLLIGITGEHAGSDIKLGDTWICIGSDPGHCQLIISPGTTPVSPAHCRVRYDSARQAIILQDLESSSGTFIHPGRKLEPGQEYTLRSGERFCLGPRDEICFEVRYQV